MTFGLIYNLYVHISRHMDTNQIISALSSLAQDTRLGVFRLLMEFGPEGAPAGMLSDELGIPHNTLSFHLAHLSRAGLVTSRRNGRSIIYAAQSDAIENVIGYLTKNCCVRSKGTCTPVKPQRKKTS